MWILVSNKNPDERYTLLVGKVYSLGRMDADITVPADKSISRKHATLQVTHPEANLSHPHKKSILSVKDLSKFGTSVQNVKLKGGEKTVSHGDVIKFGTVDTCFTVEFDPVVVTTSCLDNQAKRDLKTLIGELGGHMISEWRKECCLLVMTSLSVTVKAICALIQQKPIVTMKYVEEFLKSKKVGIKLPDPDEYAPPLAESQLNPREVSFKKNPARAALFHEKTFLFISTKQFKRLNVVVELAGGKPKLIEEGTDDDDDSILVAKDTIVMQFDANDGAQNMSQNAMEWATHVQNMLISHKKRMIPDSELGYAILYCSTKFYCNPDSDPGSQPTAAKLPPQSLSMRPDPEASEVPVQVKEEPISQSANNSNTRSSRRRGLEVSEENRSPGQESTPRSQSLSKRKRSDEDEQENVMAPNNKQRKALIEDDDEARNTPTKTRSNKHTLLASDSFVDQSVRPDHTRDEVDLFDDFELTSTRRSASKHSDAKKKSPSPTPAPRRQPRSSPRSDVRDEVDDLFDEFEVTSTRRSAPKRSIVKKKSPSPTSRSGVKDEVDDLFDEFDDISSTRRKSKKNVEPTQVSEFDDLPSTRKRKRDPDPSSPSVSARSSRQKQDRDVSPIRTDAMASPARRTGQNKRQTSPGPSSKQSPKPIHKERLKLDESRDDKANLPKVSTSSPAKNLSSASSIGFLSKDKLDGVIKTETRDPDAPSDAIVQFEYASLVVRQPKPKPSKSAMSTQSSVCNWKGKVVKNFKNFRKVAAAGSEGLPRIIGGNDLVPHNRSQRQDLDEWFDSVIQEESQRDEMEKIAANLFNYEPSKRSTRK